MRNKLLATLAVFTMFSAIEANAQASQNINVQATVNPTCVIEGSGTDIDFDFGVVDLVTGIDSETSATFTWRCSTGTNVSIQLDVGTTGGSDPSSARLLLGPGDNTISYLLCQDAACLTPWGNIPGTNDVAEIGAGMGNPASLTIYGLLNAASAQNAPTGTYTETVILSLVL